MFARFEILGNKDVGGDSMTVQYLVGGCKYLKRERFLSAFSLEWSTIVRIGVEMGKMFADNVLYGRSVD